MTDEVAIILARALIVSTLEKLGVRRCFIQGCDTLAEHIDQSTDKPVCEEHMVRLSRGHLPSSSR
jgi:hypothetical protein